MVVFKLRIRPLGKESCAAAKLLQETIVRIAVIIFRKPIFITTILLLIPGYFLDEKFVILLTNNYRLIKEKISSIYYLRWKIECLFRHLKTNGFHLEEVGMVNPRKIRVLMAVVIASFLLCILEGVKTKQRVKKDNESFYESIFRIEYGKVVFYATSIDKILKIIIQLSQKTKAQNTT